MGMNITILLITDEGCEEEHVLPACKDVCPDCRGEGFVLCEGMRGYAYSAEEFAESFDEEEAEEYMTRGGCYDVRCPMCSGTNVVDVVDDSRLNDVQRKIFNAWQEQEAEFARSRAEDRRTQWAENGYRE